MKMIKKLSVVLVMVFVICNSTAVLAKEVQNDITRPEDDPAANEPDYLVKVNRARSFTVVYALDAEGEFTVPVIEFVNSTGINNKTTEGEFTIYKKHRWQPMFGKVYTQYAVRFRTHVMFHSPYYTKKNDNSALKWTEFNKLGQQASSGCVREATVDSKWLYDHCKLGTKVIVYDDPNESGPFDMPRTVTIPDDSPYRGWDPTDPDPNNPWAEVRPILHLLANDGADKLIVLSAGATKADLEAKIGLFTPLGVTYTAEDCALEIYGVYDLQTPGEYTLYVRGFDLDTTLRADETFQLRVVP